MGKEKKAFERKDINVFWALVPLLVMIVCMLLWVVKLKQAPHIPLMIGTAVANNRKDIDMVLLGNKLKK